MLFQPETKESRRRKHSPQDLRAIEQRAVAWGQSCGVGRAGVQAHARAAYLLSLDFLRLGLGGDFPRWLAKHSGLSHTTVYRRYRAGLALATGSKRNRNLSGLLAEQREREQTRGEGMDWDAED